MALAGMVQLVFASSPSTPHTPSQSYSNVLHINGNKLSVDIADTNETRQAGLMFRLYLPTDAGMLFVFPEVTQNCFWMKNTLIPLSIAYIDTHGKIVDILDMQPHDESSICSKKPFLYALEVEQGWFKKHHIHSGHRVDKLPLSKK